jgi:hypothetical protein
MYGDGGDNHVDVRSEKNDDNLLVITGRSHSFGMSKPQNKVNKLILVCNSILNYIWLTYKDIANIRGDCEDMFIAPSSVHVLSRGRITVLKDNQFIISCKTLCTKDGHERVEHHNELVPPVVVDEYWVVSNMYIP